MNSKVKLIIYYSVALVTILIGVISIRLLILKPNLPFSYETSEGKIISTRSWETIKEESVIDSVDGTALFSDFQLEFILDNRNIGDRVKIVSSYGDAQVQSEATLVPFYSYSFILISFIISIAFILSGVFVISKKTNDSHAAALFWILLLFGLAVITSPGKLGQGIDFLSIITRVSHAVSYILGIAAFLYFSYRFPHAKRNGNLLVSLTFVPAVLFALGVSAVMIVSVYSPDKGWIKLYDILWTLVQIILSISIIIGLYSFFRTYRKLRTGEDRHKVQWILWGITAGVLPYIVLFIIPTILETAIPVPEEYSMLPMILIPVSFVFAVYRHHIFDIEIIINRSIVYSILTGFIILLYFAVVIAGTSLFSKFAGNIDRITSLIAVFIIALSLNPVRIGIQKLVNRTFYREKYNFEQALKSFSKTQSECKTSWQFGQQTVKEIQLLIPVDKIGLFTVNEDNSRLKVLAQNNMDDAVKYLNALRVRQIKSDYDRPFALKEYIQQGIEIDLSLAEVLKKWNLCLIIPLKLRNESVIGGIVLGKKLSRLKYSLKDIELLNVIASEAAIALRRLQLQEELIAKEMEYQKLEELNALKSFFVSSVTHDLKTPLTSIKMFAEMLKTKDVTSPKKKNEYLSIIEGESDRLAQLIDNVLTFSKIESGVLNYNFQPLQLSNIVNEVLELMNYQFKINKFDVNSFLSKEKLLISADKSALQSVIINLLTNSIKYSDEMKEIVLKTGKEGIYAFLTIEDKGIGIPEKDISKIFDPFFRSDNKELSKSKGTGLGLAIVKYAMDRHIGKIEVSSEPGKGTCFKLLFLLNASESNENIS